jgi:hypothetical protein
LSFYNKGGDNTSRCFINPINAINQINHRNLPREIYDSNSEVYPVKPICFFCLTGAYFTGAIETRECYNFMDVPNSIPKFILKKKTEINCIISKKEIECSL